MLHRNVNVKVEKLLILSRGRKCCRFKSSQRDVYTATHQKLLSNLKRKKFPKDLRLEWIVQSVEQTDQRFAS